MKNLVVSGLLSAAIIGLSGCEPGNDPERMIADSKALDRHFIDAFNNRDLESVMATYWNSPDFVQYPMDAMEIRGLQGVRDALEAAFAGTSKIWMEQTEANYRVAGDVVVGWGKWRLTITEPAGATTVIDGRYTDLRARRDGEWVYVLDHGSVPAMSSAAPQDSS